MIEGALAGRAVDLRQRRRDLVGSGHLHAATALLPEQKLQQPFDVAQRVRRGRMAGGEHAIAMHGGLAVGADQRERERPRPRIAGDELAVGPVPKDRGQKLRIKHRTKFGSDGKAHGKVGF